MKEDLLSRKQRILLDVAKQVGYLTPQHAQTVYHTEHSARNALIKLERYGFIKKVDWAKFELVEKNSNGNKGSQGGSF